MGVNHVVVGNLFQASCQGVMRSCLGIGYYAGRGTGWADINTWQPSMYTLNDPRGSDHGSLRCGENVYGGRPTAQTKHTQNQDDGNHRKTIYFNDPGCEIYSSSVGSTSPSSREEGRIRI